MVFSRRRDVFQFFTPKLQIMPKFAATLASLLLIASSIGVNIARYPQVGRIVDAGQPTEVVDTARSTPPAQQSSCVETANVDPSPTRKSEIEPAKPPQAAAVAPAEPPRPSDPVDAKPVAPTPTPQPQPAATILDVRPMVPVASLQAATDPPTGNDEVRRLPPLEPAGSAIAELRAGQPDETESYTTTSTP
jgi:hypothetical protein